MGDLRDQLLKAGLASKKAVKAVETEQRRENHKKLKQIGKGQAKTETTAGEQAVLAKAAEDRARAAEALEARRVKELESQVTDMIAQHALKDGGKGVIYHFPHDKVVKKLEVSEEHQQSLSRGHLAIVFWGGKYRLIPEQVAGKIDARVPEAVVYWREPDADTGEDDRYKDYQVPDDLMW